MALAQLRYLQIYSGNEGAAHLALNASDNNALVRDFAILASTGA
jgi:hypothetical protein